MGVVEYSVETLVHLYDSLNSQIESLREDIKEAGNIGLCAEDISAYEAFQNAYEIMLKRADKLEKMRNNVEELLEKILKAEVGE